MILILRLMGIVIGVETGGWMEGIRWLREADLADGGLDCCLFLNVALNAEELEAENISGDYWSLGLGLCEEFICYVCLGSLIFL